MKFYFWIIVIFLYAAGCAVYVYAVDRLRSGLDVRAFLASIDQVESGRDDAALGHAGERGRYQITRRVWSRYTAAPFRHAHRQDLANAVAEKHLGWIVRQLEEAQLAADPYNCALAWNAGLTATVNGRVTAATRDYAERVLNLYKEVKKEAAK